LAIAERSYGPDHPEVATALINLALLLQDTHRLAEAEPLFRRALAIAEQSYGPDHPVVATALNNLAKLLRATHRPREAGPLSRRAVQILVEFQRRTGHEHPNFRLFLENYRHLNYRSFRLFLDDYDGSRLKALWKTLSQIKQQLHKLIRPPPSEGS
jgi:hypothetical protein